MPRSSRVRKEPAKFVAGPSSYKPDASCMSYGVPAGDTPAKKAKITATTDKKPPTPKPVNPRAPEIETRGNAERSKLTPLGVFEAEFQTEFKRTNIRPYCYDDCKAAAKENFEALSPSKRQKYEAMAEAGEMPGEPFLPPPLAPRPNKNSTAKSHKIPEPAPVPSPKLAAQASPKVTHSVQASPTVASSPADAANDGLPPGWRMECKPRASKPGHIDKYYIAPNGKRFRSRVEAGLPSTRGMPKAKPGVPTAEPNNVPTTGLTKKRGRPAGSKNLPKETGPNEAKTTQHSTKKEAKTQNVTSVTDRHDWVCAICEEDGDLILCEGRCMRSFHKKCLGLDSEPETFLCDWCKPGGHPMCFAPGCTDKSTDVVKCREPGCGKFFHLECAKNTPFVEMGDDDTRFMCPRHTCASCTKRVNYDQAVTCIKCPATYHSGGCVPPGCKWVIEGVCVICPKHHTATKKSDRFNSDRCKLCSGGGDLVCCDGCPAAFHLACLEDEAKDIVDGKDWFCSDCAAGRRVLCGDVVWCRISTSKWWPARVCHDEELPPGVLKSNPNKPGSFAVKWLGCGSQYSWVDHTCVMPWEDRKESIETAGNRKDYQLALQEGAALHQERLGEKLEELSHIKEEMPRFDRLKKKNLYVDGDKDVWDLEPVEKCDCCKGDGKCGDEPQCINREMYVECTPASCSLGDQCQNRRIQRRQWAKTEPRKTLKCGWGLFAVEDLHAGDFIIEYQGEVITRNTMENRLATCMAKGIRTYYYMSLDNQYSIDARNKACNAR